MKLISLALVNIALAVTFIACSDAPQNIVGNTSKKAAASKDDDATPDKTEDKDQSDDAEQKDPDDDDKEEPAKQPDPVKPDPVVKDPVVTKPDPVVMEPAKPDPNAAEEAIKKACAPAVEVSISNDAGGAKFKSLVPDPVLAIQQAGAYTCLKLYKNASEVPPVTKVKLFIRKDVGVAYVTGSGRGTSELHFDSDYIAEQNGNGAKLEIDGVLIHEVTHIWQRSSQGTPSWMTEGIADQIRASGGWYGTGSRNGKGGNYDGSYTTTGFFWGYMGTIIPDFVYKLNAALATKAGLTAYNAVSGGKEISAAWNEYQSKGTFSPKKAPWQLDSPPVQLGTK